MKKIFIIVGEASGDILAQDLLKCLKQHDPALEIYGIGGQSCLRAGLTHSLFPMEELSIMGVAEILPKLPHMLKRIKQTIRAIEAIQPDILLSVDSPDFSFRVHRAVKAKRLNIKHIHTVAPTVWAWRAGRAKKIAQFLDGLLCLFPFEPPYFEKEGLPSVYTGHPVIGRYQNAPSQDEAKERLGVQKEDTLFGLCLGSRHAELKNHADVFFQTTEKQLDQGAQILVPTLPHLETEITEKISAYFGSLASFKIVSDPAQQTTYFKAMDYALAVSGTVGLELAVAGTPHIIGYKAHPVTIFALKKMVKIEYAHLANIILDKLAVPEYIQEACTPDQLSHALETLDIKGQTQNFQELRERLTTQETPAETARDFIKSLC